jgi:hypothetical protein
MLLRGEKDIFLIRANKAQAMMHWGDLLLGIKVEEEERREIAVFIESRDGTDRKADQSRCWLCKQWICLIVVVLGFSLFVLLEHVSIRRTAGKYDTSNSTHERS